MIRHRLSRFVGERSERERERERGTNFDSVTMSAQDEVEDDGVQIDAWNLRPNITDPVRLKANWIRRASLDPWPECMKSNWTKEGFFRRTCAVFFVVLSSFSAHNCCLRTKIKKFFHWINSVKTTPRIRITFTFWTNDYSIINLHP